MDGSEAVDLAVASWRWQDVLVILIYFGAITAAGIYFAKKKNKNTEDYFLGGRNFPAWAIGLSMVGTSISSVSFLAYPADAYKTAYLRLLFGFTLPIGVLVASIFFLPFFRRGKVTSAYEYLEGRFGPGTRLYAALAFLVTQIIRLGMILYLLSLLVHQLTGFDTYLCIVVGGVFVAVYTVLGGIEAVVWTDVVQTIVLVFGGFICLYFIVNQLEGGLGEIIRVGLEDNKFKFSEVAIAADGSATVLPMSWDVTFLRKTGTMMLLVGLVNWLFEYSTNQNLVQRYCASRSARDARKAMWISCAASIPIWAYFMFLGTALYAFYKASPTPESMAMLTGGEAPDGILPYFVLNVLPAGISGLVIAAVMAAAMSSLDSSISSISTVCVVDIYRRHIKKDGDDAHYLKAARSFACGAGVVMILSAVMFKMFEGKTLNDTSTTLSALAAGGLLGLYMLGFFTKIGDGRAIAAGIGCTVFFNVFCSLIKAGFISESVFPMELYYTGIVGHLIMFTVGFGAALLIPADKNRDLTNLTVWTQDGKPLD
jgi:solute:Na+ symporter, SSS family